MTTATMSVTIHRPVADVFTVLSTPELTPRWSPSAIEEHMTTAGPVGIGSRRHATVKAFGGRTMENETEVTAFERNRRMEMKSISGPLDFRAGWTFHEVAGGTRVDWIWDFHGRGLFRATGPLLAGAFKWQFQKDLNRLKAMMEAGEL